MNGGITLVNDDTLLLVSAEVDVYEQEWLLGGLLAVVLLWLFFRCLVDHLVRVFVLLLLSLVFVPFAVLLALFLLVIYLFLFVILVVRKVLAIFDGCAESCGFSWVAQAIAMARVLSTSRISDVCDVASLFFALVGVVR